ncbi:hypothetical protein ACJ41O_014733 [Fusarium nematophilum]
MGSQRHSTQDDILRDAEFLDPQSNQTPPPDEIRHPECNGDNKAPNISWRSVVHPPEGGIQLADEGGLQKGRYAPSETAQSESARSINVKDFGFSTAPCPLAPYYDLCGDDRSDKRILELISSTDRRRPSVDESEERLRAHIDNSLQGSRMDKKQYLPIDAFERIFTIDSILSVIRARSPTASSAELLKKVTRIIGEKADKSRRRIFGILVYMEELDYLDRFIEQGICDEDLPLRHSEPSMKCFTTRTCEEENSTLFQRWDRNHIQLFYVYQEMFLVPFFDFQHQRLPYYLLDPCIRLPWQALGDKTSGGFSIVRKLQIHPGHHNMGPSGPSQASHESMFFALKEVNFWNTESCDQELEAHERCRAVTQKEKHLTELLLAIRHGERLYLLFEWADDNLKEFWENNPQVETTPAVTRWVAQQCLGIARAIRRIHGYSTHHRKKRSSTPSVISDAEKDWGRHGDIKPNNILRFKAHREGRHLLVVSDLGLTRYHSRHTKSKVSRIEGCTDTYAAPEVELGYRISPRYDIWSLGCVYLEFCIWYLEGSEAVERFADERALHHESDIPGFQSESYYILTRDPRDGKQSAELNSVVGEVNSPMDQALERSACLHAVRSENARAHPGRDARHLSKRAVRN